MIPNGGEGILSASRRMDHPCSFIKMVCSGMIRSVTQPSPCFFLMYYLIDTTPQNGCLRAIPGSYLNGHELHGQVEEAHRQDFNHMTESGYAAFEPSAGEVDVPVKAGHLITGDARLFHGAYGNQSDQRRTNITLWYFPAFSAVPESIQAYVAVSQVLPEAWLEQTRTLIEPLRPVYEGDVEPITANRTQDWL